MPKYSNINLRQLIISYHQDEGMSYREIAKKLHIGLGTISYWINRYHTDMSLQTLPKCGRKRKTTEEIDSLIYTTSTKNAFMPATEICRNLQLTVSPSTVRRRLHEKGLRNFISAKKPVLTNVHKEKRLHFAIKYRHWSIRKWKQVMFSDEKLFRGEFPNLKCWRPPGTRFHSQYLRLKNKQSKFTINVWGTIGANKNTIHYINTQTLKTNYYIRNILSKYIPKNDPEIIFVFDRATIHTSKLSTQWLENNNVTYLTLPPKSPDLNPIEHAWAQIEHFSKNRKIKSNKELWILISKTFKELSEEYINKLIESMPNRLQKVIEANGNWTKY